MKKKAAKLSCLFPSRMRKRPDASGGIRRTFRGSESDSTSPGASGGVRTASLPVGSALVKEAGDKRPVSAHSILNSITRHSSLKTKVPQDLPPLSGPFCFAFGKSYTLTKWMCVCLFVFKGGEPAAAQVDSGGTLQELQQPQTAGARVHRSSGSWLTGDDR